MKKHLTILSLLLVSLCSQAQTCVPGTTCAEAPLFCGYSLEQDVFNNFGPIGTFNPACFPNFVSHSSSWFRVIPCTPILSLTIETQSTQNGDGLQLALYTSCDPAGTVACNTGMSGGAFFPLNLAATVIPGEEYWLQVDGYNGDICDFTIDVLSGIDVEPPPAPVAPFAGTITKSTPGNAACNNSPVGFSVDWPGCSTFSSPQLSCYEPEDSCKGIMWTFPHGTVYLSDSFANPVLVSFANVAPGVYTIKAKPLDCACPDDLCVNCGQVCCPVNEALLTLSIVAGSTTLFPAINVCANQWPPGCTTTPGNTVSGNSAQCAISFNPNTCVKFVQPFNKIPADTTDLGTIMLCAGDSVMVCDTVFKTPGVFTYFCSCDSAVTVKIVKDFSCFNDCTTYNFPAQPGGSTGTAPFLCGNYLDGYCSSNMDLTGGNANNQGYIRFSPCQDSIALDIAVKDCHNGAGLQVLLYDSDLAFIQSINIPNEQNAIFNVQALEPDSVYFLTVTGLPQSNDLCAFTITVDGGIGTATPGTAVCSCTNGSITGPTELCTGDIAQYTLTGGGCTVDITAPSGGNGYFCCPGGIDNADTLNLVWHIPPSMTFLSDSVNVTTITVQANPYLGGPSVNIMDSIWVSYELIPSAPGPTDSLVFCDCPAIGCVASFGSGPLHIRIRHDIFYQNCQLTCVSPTCSINGVVYNSPGIFSEEDNCETRIVNISQNIQPPFLILNTTGIITCTQPTTSVVAQTNGIVMSWSGPAGNIPGNSTSIIANQPGTYFCTVRNPSNGCLTSQAVTVPGSFIPPIAVAGPTQTICTGQTVLLNTTGSSSGPNITYQWSAPLTAGSVSPTNTTTYTVTVTNTSNGCTATASTTITVQQPTVVNHPVQFICAESWPPACPSGGTATVSGNTAACSELDLAACQLHQYSFQRLALINTQFNVQVCPNDTFWYAGQFYTQLNTPNQVVLSSYTGCDSVITFTLLANPDCPLSLCTNTNMPTAPGDSCHLAPFLCGNYLDQYCSSTSGLTDDVVDGTTIPQGGFIRFSTCDDSVHLQINVGDCTQQGGGMDFWLMSGSCTALELSVPLQVNEGGTGQFVFQSLVPDETYYLVFGQNTASSNAACQFNFEVISGIGTATPGTPSCVCSGNATISGPSDICPADIAQYTLTMPNCTTTFGPANGGNGIFCCPSIAQSDSTTLRWHLPPGLHFLSDSINVNTISVQADSSMLGLDTTITGTIYITFEQHGATDTLLFCDCSAACAISFEPKEVTIHHEIEYYSCFLNCAVSSCDVNGITYTIPGNFIEQTNCKTTIVVVNMDNNLPVGQIVQNGPPPCFGASVELLAITDPGTLTEWQGPGVSGFFGPSVTVFQSGIYSIIVTGQNGCTSINSYNLIFPPPVIAATSPDITICAGQSTVLSATGSSTGNVSYQWSNGGTGFSTTVTPAATTTYALTVIDNPTGCTATASVIVTVDPLQMVQIGQVGAVTCNTPCFVFQGKTYCTPGNYQDTMVCEIRQFSVGFARDTVQSGQIGTISCAQTCVAFQGQNYCQEGNYTAMDSCSVYHFSINANLTTPVYSAPTHTCLPGNSTYAVGFSITGTPPYKVNGNPITGSYYLSEPVQNGTTYTYIIEQTANGCQSLVTGTFSCAFMCASDAAVMQTTPANACLDETITVQVLVPAQTNGLNDTSEFVLHTLAGNTTGVILSRNTSGIFAFDPASMQAGTTYYVSGVAGPANSLGQVDLSDVCTTVSPGQPVIFHAAPSWSALTAQSPTCFGDNDGWIELNGISAVTPWNISLNGGLPSGQSRLEGLKAGEYILVITDAFGCADTTSTTLSQPDSVWLTVSDSRDFKQGEQVLLLAQTNIPNLPVWENQHTLEQFSGLEWTVQPTDTTEYHCTVTDNNGCTAFATVTLRLVSEGLYHPNVVSPTDANPENHWFTIFAAPGYVQEIVVLRIFDRWGNQVFQRTHFEPGIPEMGWNGVTGNRRADPAVYTFAAQVLLTDGTVKNIAGDVTLIR